MAFADIEVDVDLAPVLEHLAKIQAFASEASMALFLSNPVEQYMHARMDERFANEGDDVVGAWAPLEEITNFLRERQGFPREHPINVRTGGLRDWMLEPGFLAVAAGSVSRTWPNPTATGGDPFAQIKFEVAQQGNDNTPARPVLGFNEVDDEAISGLLAEWFLRMVAS